MDLHSVLIANRGEIAVRVIRACHRLGLRAVAVFSDADRDAPFVEMADAAVHIGGAPAAESYLNATALIAAAKRAGADAVHPGYGFLAENAAFARACAEAGLTFVGPAPETIAEMGSKIAAKAAAEAAGLPVVPGYHGEDQSDEILTREAGRIGAPLMIKASAGGGGRGMRRVDDLDAFAQALEMARGEARAAFGDDTVLLERYVARARHIEVQVLADHHGKVVHLYERDCSIQRNHQKVIEEAPAPNLPAATRAALLEHAVALAAGIGYRGAGTVEYILDADSGAFYFLEMNTRLQVEHPVTERVTGLDLVEWQLRVAGGEPLPFAQADIRCDGWAIEARVAAEDPAKNFLPRVGTVAVYREPAIDGLRIDSGLRQGSAVSHHYDSMLAKVIAGGRDRRSALRALRRGLAQFRIGGVGVNTAFLLDLLHLPAVVAGEHDTGLIPATWPRGWTAPVLSPRHRAEAALAMLLHGHRSGSPWESLGAWRVTEPAGRCGACLYRLREPRGDLLEAVVEGRGGDYRVRLDDETEFAVEGARLQAGRLIYEEQGLRRTIELDIAGPRVTLHTDGGSMDVEVLRPEQALRGRGDVERDGHDVRAPMPGRVAEVLVEPGQEVTAGQPVVVLEAMKLLQRLVAPRAGRVSDIPHAAGETVDSGALLVSLATGSEP